MGNGEGYWECGHCGYAPLSFRLDRYCLNTSCGHRKDVYARVYDADWHQISESSGSPSGSQKTSSGSQKRMVPRTRKSNTSVIVKRAMGEESEDLGSVILEDSDSHRTSLLPPNLQSLLRVIMGIPNHCLTFSTGEDLSFSNKCKAFLEEVSGERWCWWPFRPRMRLLQDDEIRMHWRCNCGSHLWTEIPTANADLIMRRLANRGTGSVYDHLCGVRLRQESWSWRRVLAGIRYSSPSASGHQGQDSPSAGHLSSQNPPTTSPGGNPQDKPTQDSSTPQRSQTNQQQSTNTIIDVRGTNQSVVLLGVKGPRITLELAQIDTQKYGRDDLFFWALKQQYKQLRGGLRYWLSVWTLSHCDFVKFEKIWADAIICRGKELPTDTIYDYDPRPPNADNPPISPHEFEAAFASCGNRCKLAPFHACSKVPDRYLALKRIPKRKWEVETKTEEREHVWGLVAQHVISFLRVLVYHALVLSGSFGFWAWWLVKHPDDLQSAAVPATTALTLLSLFWSASGIIKNSRGPA